MEKRNSKNKIKNLTLPKEMNAQVIRRNRYGDPQDAFKKERVSVPSIERDECLIKVMAAGINHNGVWAARGYPIDLIALHEKRNSDDNFHIAGSDASGIVCNVGEDVTEIAVGDEVVLHCGWWESEKCCDDEILHPSAKIWGYETNYGAFAEYTKVKKHAVLPKPKHLNWFDSATYMLCGATAYRMLHGFPPNNVKENDVVLIWGGSGGVGSIAIQLARIAGAIPIAVVGDNLKKEKERYCLSLGAAGVINRHEFVHWGALEDDITSDNYGFWLREARKFQRKIWNIIGARKNPQIIIEHPGQDTIPTSLFVCDAGGMVVTCAGTTGYKGTYDIRYQWMKQKRLQGSHFANGTQCKEFNDIVTRGEIHPKATKVFEFHDTGKAHQLLHNGGDTFGNYAINIGVENNNDST